MSSPVRYVVRRQEYTPPTAAGVRRVLPEKWTVAATFAKPDVAHAEYAKLLTQTHRTLNPFQLGGPNLFYQTSLPAYALHDYLLDHGLTPPLTVTSSNPNYVFWWVKNNRTFTDGQRAVVWQACDKLKLFELVEEDDRKAAHVVVETAFAFSANTGGYEIAEGGYLRSAHPTRHDANRACRELRESLRGRTMPDDDSFELTEQQLAKVVSIPLTSRLPTHEVNALCRQDFSQSEGSVDLVTAERPLIPLRAYTTRTESQAAISAAVNKVRRSVNPISFLDDEYMPGYFLRLLRRSESELPNDLTVEDAFATLRRLDTTPPPPEPDELLADWYDQVVQWSPEYIDVIWGTFADFRLFEVVEVPFG